MRSTVLNLAMYFLTNWEVSSFVSNGFARRCRAVFTSPTNTCSSAFTGNEQRQHDVQTSYCRNARELSATSGGSQKKQTPSWRSEVDEFFKAASPWGSSVEAEILAMDLLKRLPEIASDVTEAARQGNLISDVVLAEGTEARMTVEGLQAVSRQLREDVVPEAIDSAPRIAKAASESLRSPRDRSESGAESSTSGASTRKGPVEGIAETLYAIRGVAKGLTPRKIREGLQSLSSEAVNVVSRTPEGLYTPEYSLEDERDGFQVRRYGKYAVCSAPMTEGIMSDTEDVNGDMGATRGSGEGFNTLAGYLFGNNTQERAMDMTTPVNIDVVKDGERTMSFVMPKEISANDAPTPRDPRIRVGDVADGELLAVREFAGFATDGEVKRQVTALLGALEREATLPWSEFGEAADAQEGDSRGKSPWRATDPSGLTYRLMQYNPPYTLPWLRTNAVAVKVAKGDESSSVASSAVGATSDMVDEGDIVRVSDTVSQTGTTGM